MQSCGNVFPDTLRMAGRARSDVGCEQRIPHASNKCAELLKQAAHFIYQRLCLCFLGLLYYYILLYSFPRKTITNNAQ